MRTRCPRCHAQLKVLDELTGKKGRCPKCHEEFRIEPETPAAGRSSSTDSDIGSVSHANEAPKNAGPLSDEFGEIASPRLLAATRPVKRKQSEAEAGDDTEVQAGGKSKRRLRSRRTTVGLLASLVAAPFWHSALRHFPYLAGALACVGALTGFLVGLVHNAVVAGLVFNLIGVPTAFVLFFMMCYPSACFWKVIVGSSEGSGDIAEWPAGNFGEWAFEMLFVGYLVLISLFLSAGVAKLRQVLLHNVATQAYWQITVDEEEEGTVSLPEKLLKKLGNNPAPAETEVTSPRAPLRPGAGWQTTFVAFVVIFPFVVASCLEPSTPIFIPWSARVWLSLFKNVTAWLVAAVISAAVLGAAAAILLLGATFAPFWTFTLCSPLAAVGLLVYGRLLGRLSWLISRT